MEFWQFWELCLIVTPLWVIAFKLEEIVRELKKK